MLLLLSILALWHGVSSNAYFPYLNVGFHSNDYVYKIGDMSKTQVSDKYIKESFGWISENTCVNFIEHNAASDKKIDFTVEHTKNAEGFDECQFLDPVLSLGDCLASRYTIVHETMHALGLYHTQNRPDWPQYIRVLPGKKVNQPPTKATPVVAYDYGSGMHHKFSPNVLVPLDEAYMQTMGQSVRFSFSDYYSINWLYNCSGNCATQPDCKNGGYTHPRDCTKCMCNKYYIGDFCEAPRNLIVLSCEGKREYSWSLNHAYNDTLYENRIFNDDFLNRGDDRWDIIEGPQNMLIEVEILSNPGVEYKNQYSPACVSLTTEVNDGDFNLAGKMFCGSTDSPPQNFIAKSNKLGFHTEYPEEYELTINAKFTLLGCDAPPSSTTTTTTSEVQPPVTTTTESPMTTVTSTSPPTTTTQEPTTTTLPPSTTTTVVDPVITTTDGTPTEKPWCEA